MQPARVWRRGVALAIDYFIIIAVLQVVAIVLFPLTGGRIQSGGLVQISECRWPPSATLQFPYASSAPRTLANVTTARDCWVGPWGLRHAHVLKLERSRAIADGITLTTRAIIPLDAHSRAVPVLWLDALILPLLVLFRIYFESRSGATLGKRLLGLRVLSDAKPPLRAQAVTRNLVLFLPFVPLAVLAGGLLFLSPFSLGPNLTVAIASGLASFGAATWAIAVAVVARGTGIGPHDRWAGTKVVGRASMPPTSSASDA